MNKIIKFFLIFIYIFILIHFLKDITQDILRLPSPLDMFGDIKEDISFLPPVLQHFFYYVLGGMSFMVEGFLLVAIPKVLLDINTDTLKKLVFMGIGYLLTFLITCTLLDPRFNPLKNNPAVSQSITELIQERPNCELQSNQLRSQPLNLITNFAFLITSYLIFRLIKNEKVKDKGIHLLFLTSILIGFGSIAHHTVPTNFTLLLDGIPIYIFLYFGFCQILDILTEKKELAFLLPSLYIFLNIFISLFIHLPIDSNALTPIINLFLFIPIIFIFYKRFGNKTNLFSLSLGFYALATIFFVLDEIICNQLPFGTHFLWHIFNAAAIYYFVKFIIAVKQQSVRGKPIQNTRKDR